MHSATYLVALLSSALVNGASVPSVKETRELSTVSLSNRQADGSRSVIARTLNKREPVSAVILATIGTAAVTAVVTEAVGAVVSFIGDISNFDSGREAFTQQTTEAMMANNPDPARFVAAACYNQAFEIADPANSDGQTSVEFSLGILNTDYECMYLAAPNQFFTQGDGGFINVSEIVLP
ncbi:hypothetical protein ACHAQA_006842 [Verticillium albo-atrum]